MRASSKQTNAALVGMVIDGEVADGVAQAVKDGYEWDKWGLIDSNGQKTRAAVPQSRSGSVEVAAEGVVKTPIQVATHALQISHGGAARQPQTGDDGVLLYGTIGTLLRGEVGRPGGQIDYRTGGGGDVAGVVTSCNCVLTEYQGEAGRICCVQVGVDVDVAVRA